MTAFLLLYEKIWPVARGDWRPLLQQQAILAASRVVLAGEKAGEALLSAHRFLAPANTDILPLLAVVAQEYAKPAEPEGKERPRAPISLYRDTAADEPRGEMRSLLHPAWFEPPMALAEAVGRFKPEICFVAGSLRRAAGQLLEYGRNLRRIVYLECLSGPDDMVKDERLPPMVAADAALSQRIGGRALDLDRSGMRKWDAAFPEDVPLSLERFVAFGPAFEMTLLDDERLLRR